nr:hypothetical protein [uncultured Pseudodesulfovibrio sp.]
MSNEIPLDLATIGSFLAIADAKMGDYVTGKILDAEIRFVWKKSRKRIRLKLKNAINQSTEKHPILEKCFLDVVFQEIYHAELFKIFSSEIAPNPFRIQNRLFEITRDEKYSPRVATDLFKFSINELLKVDDLIKFIHRDQIKILQAQLQNFGTKLSKHDSRLDALELEHQEIDVDELIVAAKAATAETINRWEESSLFPYMDPP